MSDIFPVRGDVFLFECLSIGQTEVMDWLLVARRVSFSSPETSIAQS